MINLQILSTYLRQKVSKSNAHKSCKILKENFDIFNTEIDNWFNYIYQIIATHYTRRSVRGNTSYQGEANLTQVSLEIADYIFKQLGIEQEENEYSQSWFAKRIMMGDLFIECFYNNNLLDIGKNLNNDKGDREFITIDRMIRSDPKDPLGKSKLRSLYRSRTHYVIKDLVDLDNIDISLLGTEVDRPKDISDIIQPTNKPVIKGWTEDRRSEFKQYLLRDFIKSMDILQQTGWRINKDVHNAVLRHKEKLLNRYLHLPDKYKSKKIEWILTLGKAKKLLDKTFYQYTECDYRGRIYYTTSFLNFQSNDLARGQMQFAMPVKLTEEGLRWLKIHTACSYNKSYHIDKLPEWLTTDYKPYLLDEELETISVDKMTLEDRELWTDMNMDLILEIARRDKILPSAEKPISFFACCLELYNIVDNIQQGKEHWSSIPIPIDGSNNGWQHLSAISKDKHAGKLVGVVPQKIQKDFYVQTAKELIKLMPEWFEKRNMPMKHIRKGISKRGSMTRAYSAGAEKIAENMYADCHVEGYLKKYNITMDDCRELAKNLIKAIDKVCAGPLQTMKYLQKIAEAEIASEYAREIKRKAIEWSTPSGFPVKYESFHANELKWRTNITCNNRKDLPKDQFQIKHVGKEFTDIPKIRSFMSGISPNFIHSMDAAHMSNVICSWNKAFGAVHDSFSVHASDVDELLQITKDEFIKLYDYHNYFDEIVYMILTDPTSLDYNQPQLGDLNILEVNNSDYFFA